MSLLRRPWTQFNGILTTLFLDTYSPNLSLPKYGKQSSVDQRQEFYKAHMTGNEDRKRVYKEQTYPQTLATLCMHVNYLINELDELSESSVWRKDIDRHARLPLLMRHNEFVKSTFESVQRQLDHMST